MRLSDKDGGTLLTYNVEAQIGGKLAQLGQRLINGAAKKMADEFFQKFAAAVSGRSAYGGAFSPRCGVLCCPSPLTCPRPGFRVVLVPISDFRQKRHDFAPGWPP